MLLVPACLVEIGLPLLLRLLAFLFEAPDHFVFYAVVCAQLAVGGLAEVVEGIIIYVVNLIQIVCLELVRVGVALREGELIVANSGSMTSLGCTVRCGRIR